MKCLIRLNLIIIMAAIFLFSAGISNIRAQFDDPGEMPSSFPDKDARDMLQALKIWKITQELNVSEEFAQKLYPRLDQLHKLHEHQMEENKRSVAEMRQLVQSGKASDSDYNEALKKFNALKDLHRKQIKDAEDLLFSLFTPEQKIKYILLERDFPKKVREYMRKERHRRGQNYDRFEERQSRRKNKRESDS